MNQTRNGCPATGTRPNQLTSTTDAKDRTKNDDA